MKTAERCVELLRILCNRRYETMENLAKELGVSVRTIQRDIDRISTYAPIFVKSGRYGGGIYIIGQISFEQICSLNQHLSLILKKIKKNK